MFVPAGSPVGCRIYTAKVVLTVSFLATIEDIYKALTEKEVWFPGVCYMWFHSL
jgi:hypothetical protein